MLCGARRSCFELGGIRGDGDRLTVIGQRIGCFAGSGTWRMSAYLADGLQEPDVVLRADCTADTKYSCPLFLGYTRWITGQSMVTPAEVCTQTCLGAQSQPYEEFDSWMMR
jgi:hypothetical protein